MELRTVGKEGRGVRREGVRLLRVFMRGAVEWQGSVVVVVVAVIVAVPRRVVLC